MAQRSTPTHPRRSAVPTPASKKLPERTPARAKPAPKPSQKPAPKSARKRAPRIDDPKKRLGVDERRAQLIVLGRRLFKEHSYDALSIDDIAKAAGISKGLLYHYFPSKRDFYVATVKDAAEQLLETTTEIAGLTPPEQAVRRINNYLDFVEANAGAFVTLMRSGVGHDREVARVVDGTRDALVTRILTNIGVGPRPIFRLAMRSWIGLVEAASLEWIEGPERVSRELVATFLVESLAACLDSARRLDPQAAFRLASQELP
jgi:AcrR family transcriptional regulator